MHQELIGEPKSPLVFQYQQLTENSKYGGSGLGLFISKSLCELQGGEIGVYSAGVGQGSTFAFYIKSTLVASAPEQPGSPIDNGIASLQIAVINPADISILVTEDNIVNSKVLVQQLKKRGFVVHVAYHGVEALNILRNSTQWKDNSSGHKIDIITMDVVGARILLSALVQHG